MPTSRVKTSLFPTFEIAAKCQNVCYTSRSHRLILQISKKSTKNTFPEKNTPAKKKKKTLKTFCFLKTLAMRTGLCHKKCYDELLNVTL